MLCPVLVGRDDLLLLAERRLDAALAGAGHLLFLAGEAGIGKTRLLGAVTRRAALRGVPVVCGTAFRGDEASAGGLILDLARGLGCSADAATRDVGAAVAARLLEEQPAQGDRHRRRRLLVMDVADALAALADAGPVALAFEDLHWADDLSLAVLGRLAARLPGRPMLVLGTYRSDELYPRVPMREWRSRLLTQRLAEEARLGRLTATDTATMVSAVLGGAAGELAATLHERSDGIPLHVEELLGAMNDGVPSIPDTLADGIRARVGALPIRTQRLAAAAAVIGRSFDFDLLVAVADADPADVAADLRRLEERFVVVAGPDRTTYDFRHALIRDALYADVPLPRRREMHARVARMAKAGDAFVSVHYEQAGLTDEAHRHAVAGARDATRLSAHREALDLYRRARRCLPTDAGPAQRAGLLAALATEAAAIDENAEAETALAEAHLLYADAGDVLAATALLPPLVAVRHLLGAGLAERVATLEAGASALDAGSGAPGGAAAVGAAVLAGISAAYMLDRRLDEAIDYGQRAHNLDANGDIELNTLATLGSVLVFAGRMDEGWARLTEAVCRSVAAGAEAEAARAYRMIGSSASVLAEYDLADRWLGEGIAYAERVELWNHRHYMAAHLGHVRWARGDLDGAQDLAAHALADGRGGLTTRITALHVLGYVALSRARWDEARMHLEEARTLGERMAELQRFSPALWGLAEVALRCGDPSSAYEYCERGYAASVAVSDAAYLFPFVVTGVRAATDGVTARDWVDRCAAALRHRSIPGTLPALVHAQGLLDLAAGRTRPARTALNEAHHAWRRRGRWWEATSALADLAECATRSGRRAEAAALAARANEAAADAAALAEQAARVAHPSLSPKAPWEPLSAREFEVARLVANGLTNREIAARLVLSPKTISAHVEHILAKLGAARRSEVAAWVAGRDTPTGRS